MYKKVPHQEAMEAVGKKPIGFKWVDVPRDSITPRRRSSKG